MLKRIAELPAPYALIVIVFVIAVIAIACGDPIGSQPPRVQGINENAVTEFTYTFADGAKVRCIELADHGVGVWCREPTTTTTTVDE